MFSPHFFLTLWYRSWVFFGPGDFPKHTPVAEFVGVYSQATSPKTVTSPVLTALLGHDSIDENAQFGRIGSLLGELEQQIIILMHLEPCDLLFPELDNGKIKYEVEYDLENQATGQLDGQMFYSTMMNTGFIVWMASERKVSLTEAGHRFAHWLIMNGRKALSMKTKYGKWGKPTLT